MFFNLVKNHNFVNFSLKTADFTKLKSLYFKVLKPYL